ncbi:MAG: RNase adapter RapZ, partial [Gemmobacter sp.]
MRPDVRLILVTGLSGAGRTTAIGALEDLGCETIDNLPLRLIPRLLDGPPLGRPLALGLAAANRDFSAASLIELIDRLTLDPRVDVEVIYLDCAPEVLIRRYSETRRRHP